MTKFKNGDVLIHNNDHSAELIFMSYIPKSDGSFIAWSDDENDYDVYTDEQWKIKPKKEKRWLGVNPLNHPSTTDLWGSGANVVKFLQTKVGVDYEKLGWQIIQIEVEV